jgi:diguanylate cyclase (GGDEF)-like protein/PAS domain S-box-containing protein
MVLVWRPFVTEGKSREMQTFVIEEQECKRDPVRQILEDVVEGVVKRTQFRRAVASFYEHSLAPGASIPETHILRCAGRGIPPAQERELLQFVTSDGRVSGARYHPHYRVSNSYFFPNGVGLPSTPLILRSSRRFLNPTGWQTPDVLLVPFWVDSEIVGQISVDDPRDGIRPNDETLHRLEEVASVTAVALCQTNVLERLSERHRVFRFLAESAMTGVLVVQDDHIRYANRRACELLGYKRERLLSLEPWWQVAHPDDRPLIWRQNAELATSERTIRAVRKDGRTIWLVTHGYKMEHEGSEAVAYHLFDITDRVETEALLKEKALRDPLTGLFNRSYFEDAIQTELRRSKRYRRPLTLMMADLAGFKLVNDQLGHQEGDRILSGVAGIICTQLRDSDWVVRYGGDEFLFVLPETGQGVEALEDRLSRAVTGWGKGNAANVNIAVDLGWATWTPDRERTISELICEADAMLYRKKETRPDAR